MSYWSHSSLGKEMPACLYCPGQSDAWPSGKSLVGLAHLLSYKWDNESLSTVLSDRMKNLLPFLLLKVFKLLLPRR